MSDEHASSPLGGLSRLVKHGLEFWAPPSQLYWIDHGRGAPLAIMARPRAGEALSKDVQIWREAGVRRVVSLLEPDEARALGLDAEATACAAQGLDWLNFPIPDHDIPADRDALLAFARPLSQSDEAIAIHCFAGIGRSSLMAASLLTLRGLPAQVAFDRISAARGRRVPDTEDQRQWVMRLAP